MHTTVYGAKCDVVYGAILRWPGLRWNTARFRAVSHRKRAYTAKLRLKIRLSVIIDQVYYNSFSNATLLVIPITSKLVKTALHQFHISPHDTVNQTVIRMRSIIWLDYSMFIRQSKIEPMNDYLQKDVSTSFIKWWRWRINGILPSFWLLTILFWTYLHMNYSRIIILSLGVHKREKMLSHMLSIDKLFYQRDVASICSDCIITKAHT
jgi:hypothetical protein